MKISVEYIYRISYPSFFKLDVFNSNSIGDVAIDICLELLDKSIDPYNLFGRFVWLESDFKNI